MPTIKVDGTKKHPRPYWPKELLQEGFIGQMVILNDAVTATIIHPNADLDQAKRSLQLVLKDIDLRIERERKGRKKV